MKSKLQFLRKQFVLRIQSQKEVDHVMKDFFAGFFCGFCFSLNKETQLNLKKTQKNSSLIFL